jgi:hypothetical protein
VAGDKAQRRAAIALLAAYHEAQLADLIEHVRDGLARYDAGKIDAFELDAVMHRYQRAARELWKFCSTSGAHAVTVARLLEEASAAGDLPDWWERAKPRER